MEFYDASNLTATLNILTQIAKGPPTRRSDQLSQAQYWPIEVYNYNAQRSVQK